MLSPSQSTPSTPRATLEKQSEKHDDAKEEDDNNSTSPSRNISVSSNNNNNMMSRTDQEAPNPNPFNPKNSSLFPQTRQPIFTHPLSSETTPESYLVTFSSPSDPYNPKNWPLSKKISTTLLYGLTTMASTFASAVLSPGTDQVAAEFRVDREVASLGTALLLFGFAFGPLIWAPLSEVYGRKPAVLGPSAVAMVFAFAGGAAEDVRTLLICRFFEGFFGAAPVTNTGGVIGDLFAAEKRAGAIVGYSVAVVAGPNLGPIVGSVICANTSWRWTQYTTGLFQAVVVLMGVLCLEETYAPALLTSKARALRFTTGNWALHAQHERWNVSFRELGRKYLVRPFRLLFTPICAAVATYASFVYGILYASLEAFPIVFEDLRGYSAIVASLPYLAMFFGAFLGMATNLFNQSYYTKRWKLNGNRAVPEARLPPMMLGSVALVAGMFLFAWTAPPHVFWLVPCIGIALIGFGFITIFQAALNYLIDTFEKYSASAIGANTFLRSIMAAAFTLFMTPLLDNIGVEWGLSIFGFVSIALLPIPYVFWFFGERIRAKGAWSSEVM